MFYRDGPFIKNVPFVEEWKNCYVLKIGEQLPESSVILTPCWMLNYLIRLDPYIATMCTCTLRETRQSQPIWYMGAIEIAHIVSRTPNICKLYKVAKLDSFTCQNWWISDDFFGRSETLKSFSSEKETRGRSTSPV